MSVLQSISLLYDSITQSIFHDSTRFSSAGMQIILPGIKSVIKYGESAFVFCSRYSFHPNPGAFRLVAMALFVFCLAYHPFLRFIIRPTLRSFIGMNFGRIQISLLQMSIGFTDIIILPHESPVLLPVFAALFPSAVVKTLQKSENYPDSQLLIDRLKIKLRVGTFAGAHLGDKAASVIIRARNALGKLIPCPFIVVKLSNVTILVEKSYIAPEPTSEFGTCRPFPSAILPSSKRDPTLPTFDQEYVLQLLRENEVNDANQVTFWIERWIAHSMTMIKRTSNGKDDVATTTHSQGKPANNNTIHHDKQTEDQKMNARMTSVLCFLLHSISIHIHNAAIVISGADSEFVKETRTQYSSSDANLILGKLPKSERSSSIIGADFITLSFSPDEECNLLLCCAGIYIKVGHHNPIQGGKHLMTWHSIAQPFHVVTELKGILPILLWVLNYDHHFERKVIDLKVSVSELTFSLSPTHLHTLLLHLDDFVDSNSPYNEWFCWLLHNHMATLGVTEDEMMIYSKNYARLKTVKVGNAIKGNKSSMSAIQIKDLERRMTRHQILSLRCFAMRSVWRIPKENKEFVKYLESSRSSIIEQDCNQRIWSEGLSPFQQEFPTPLHALVTLVRQKNSLPPKLSIKYIAPEFSIELPSDAEEKPNRKEFTRPRVPTAITVSELRFELLLTNALFSKTSSVEALRHSLTTSMYLKTIGWGVVDSDYLSLPSFANKVPVGIIYKHQTPSNEHMLVINLKINVAPTLMQEPSISLDLRASDFVVILNPIPLVSGLETLMVASCPPFQTIEGEESKTDLAVPQSRKIESDDVVSDSSENLSSTVSADIDFKVEHVSILFLADGAICRDILDFSVKELGVRIDSTGMSGAMTISTDLIQLCAGQVVLYSKCVGWELLPFKPTVTVSSLRFIVTVAEKCNMKLNSQSTDTPMKYDIDSKLELGCILVGGSPSTTVALIGSLNYLKSVVSASTNTDPIKDSQELEVKNRRRTVLRQREQLQSIFQTIDIDKSQTLQKDELDVLIRMMFDQSSGALTESANGLTSAELKREKNFFMSLIDLKGLHEVTFSEVDVVLYRIANNIDDVNLIPEIKSTGINYLDNFKESNNFLSGLFLRQLVYFDDLREYSAWHFVYLITGQERLDKPHSYFPAPTFWHANGIEIFWDMYISETGCTRTSLNGQDIRKVQQKLVRSLCNYEFGKYCWRILVQPQFHSISGLPGTDENSSTSWLLDVDPKSRVNTSAVDLLLKQVKNRALDPEVDTVSTDTLATQFSLHLGVVVDSVIVTFGSSHTFSNPLIEVTFSRMNSHASVHLSQNGFLPGISNQNEVSFQSIMGVTYLNTKHDHMDCFVQSYPCYGSGSYTAQNVGSAETPSFSVFVDCPRFLNIDVSPPLLETLSMLTSVISYSDPCRYRQLVLQSEVDFVRKDLDFRSYSASVSSNTAPSVIQTATKNLTNDNVGGTDSELKELLSSCIELMDTDSEGKVLLEDVTRMPCFRSVSCFSGCKELHIRNNLGRAVRISDRRPSLHATTDFHGLSETFSCIEDGNSTLIKLSTSNEGYEGLFLVTEKYKLMSNIAVSPYQSTMIPLLRKKKQQGKNRQKQSVSGFIPTLTLVPKVDSLDAISVEFRSCVSICTRIPVNIRIVRLPKSLGYLSKSGTKTQIDLSKKNLVPAMRRLVRGASIVYEKDGLVEGMLCALPLDLLDSSHYHALLIQDITNCDRNEWRDPVLLTRDFLFNSADLREISRSLSLSGIVVQKERLNVQASRQNRNNFGNSNFIQKATAWDTIILIVPYFLLQNSMLFPLSVKLWQLCDFDQDSLWVDPMLSVNADEDSSGEEDNSSSWRGNSNLEQKHLPREGRAEDFYSEECVGKGQSIRLSGINLERPVYLQVSQTVRTCAVDGAKHMWSKTVKINLAKLRTGANRKGSLSLPNLILDMGDDVDALVNVSIDGEIRMPICSIFAPYWIMNKTGMKVAYKVFGQSMKCLDSGNGGLPVMMNGATESNGAYKKASSDLSVIPVECPNENIVRTWWNEGTNGTLVLGKNAIRDGKGRSLVGWSDHIEMNAAGTSGKIFCKDFELSTTIVSLAGAFFKSNLITISPRFVVKNLLHISVTVVPLCGTQNDAIEVAKQLRVNPELYEKDRLTRTLAPNQSTIFFRFNQMQGIGPSDRWIAFCVNADRSEPSFKCRWHLIPAERTSSTYYGEHDGLHDTLCGILEAKVHSSDGAARVASILHAANPPFRIENRSNTHYLQLSQDETEAIVFELPPMHSCGYTWDCPLGNKRLRVVASEKNILNESLFDDNHLCDINELDDTSACTSKSKKISTPRPARSQYYNKSIETSSVSSFGASNVTLRQRGAFRMNSRTYDMTKVGRKKSLPVGATSSRLLVHLRIIAGAKILSFNDSDFLAQQVESGMMRKGGGFKHADGEIDLLISGLALYVMDSFPRELLGITVRDINVHKPRGSIEATLRIRHFQVDAMLLDARYPIMFQPLPLGVDRRVRMTHSDMILHDVDKNECYWKKHDERPIPVLEITGSYVPQDNMTWIPNLYVMLCPMKLQIDVDYILRVVGVVSDSISKYKPSSTTSYSIEANALLNFATQGQLNILLTYIEKLYIAPVYFEIELDIKQDESDKSRDTDESALTLNSIARSTNSAVASGILSWVINVGANFAHVSPTFKYSHVTDADRYCDLFDLVKDIAFSYIVQTIQQSYKVIFSMHLLGDPSLLAHQVKTGCTDLVFKTRDEVKAAGKDGFGKGFASFLQHVVGGTFFALGKATGAMAKTIDSVTSNDLTSTHLRPQLASHRKRPHSLPEGIVHGTVLLGETIVYGVAGIIGNPYRGAMTGTATGLAKGVISGLSGVFVCPLIGALGFIAKCSDGIGAQTKSLEIGVIEARCRPARIVPWGFQMNEIELPYMKAIGVRVHCVRYQKVRKRIMKSEEDSHDDDSILNWQSSKEFKRIRTAEERRKFPPRKVVTILYNKEKRLYATAAATPKLLTDQPQSDVLSHYAVVFQDTIILRASHMQLGDEVVIQFRNNRVIKSASNPLASCKLTIGDIYSSLVIFCREQMRSNDLRLSQKNSDELVSSSAEETQSRANCKSCLVIPAPQDFSLFRRPKNTNATKSSDDAFDLIRQELKSVQIHEDDRMKNLDSDSSSSLDNLLLDYDGKPKKYESPSAVGVSERLFGSVSLSFFPIPW